MPPEALEYKTKKFGRTLHYAATNGNTEIAEALIKKNASLTQVRDHTRKTALEYAVCMEQGDN